MAHKKGAGSSDNGRDSNSKRLGVKLFGGQYAIAGNIIVRQRGTRHNAGENVYMGKDHTLHARVDGIVKFEKKRKNRSYVSILPVGLEEALTMDAPKKAVKTKEAPKAKEAPVKEAPVKEAPKAKEAPVKEAPKAKETPKKEAPKAKEAPKKEAPKAALPSGDAGKAALLGKIGDGSGKKDDLKKISGVGPKLEEVLNSIGIVSFEQISKMTDSDLDLMDSLTGKFPGRAKRDNWIGQAKEFASADEK